MKPSQFQIKLLTEGSFARFDQTNGECCANRNRFERFGDLEVSTSDMVLAINFFNYIANLDDEK